MSIVLQTVVSRDCVKLGRASDMPLTYLKASFVSFSTSQLNQKKASLKLPVG